MPSPVSQNVINVTVSLPISRGSSAVMYVSVQVCRAFENLTF